MVATILRAIAIGGELHRNSDNSLLRTPPLNTGSSADRVAARRQLVKFHVPEIVFGEDAMVEAAHSAARLGGRRPLLVTDSGLLATGWPTELLTFLRWRGITARTWSEVTPNPKDREIHAGFEFYASHGCDALIALGGGSVIDAAKGIAILAANGGSILEYEGVDRVRGPIPPVIAVPSTAGTGADVSQFCIVTDTARSTKITIVSRALVPDVTVVDPRLLVTMPDWLSAATGLDALSHGVEAYVSLGHNQLTDHHALRAVSTVARNLVHTLDEPKFLPSRIQMAQASLEAGLAFTNAILGAAHAMSHAVGGMLDLPHGVINGVLLPHVIRFNAEADPRPFVNVAGALGLPECLATPQEAAGAVADEVAALARRVGVPDGLSALGVRENHVPKLAMLALNDACLITNPRPADERDLQKILRAAL